MNTRLPAAGDLAMLVRLPAALTVPGDVYAGASAAGAASGNRWAMPAASVCLYWAGMALNDYADRELDRWERPERPIPSGRVRPRQALVAAGGLTAVGLGAAALLGGKSAMRVAAPLAAVVWAYDLHLKHTSLGPVAMAAARGLDVLLGAHERPRAALLPATAMAAHTAGVTALSRGEVYGCRPGLAAGVAAGTGLTALAVAGRPRSPVAAVLAGAYALTVGGAQLTAALQPDAATVRRATGVGIRGMIPLQAALVSRTGALSTAAALLAAGPVAKVASKVVSPT
jgi:hypothetical protein